MPQGPPRLREELSQGRPFVDARSMAEGIVFRYRTGITWRDLPPVFGAWQTVTAWHHRMAVDGTWDRVLAALTAEADAVGAVGWTLSVDCSIARAHQPTTNVTHLTGDFVELQESAVG